MSALDLFASGMGAFILIAIILLIREMGSAPPICPPPTPAQTCEVCPICQSCPETPVPEPCPEARIADVLIVVQGSWQVSGDMDLYVKTPDGLFYFGNNFIPGRPGQMTLDNRSGGRQGNPALEIWQSYEPTPGKYLICFDNFNARNRSRMGGRIDKPSGPVDIPRVSLRSSERKTVYAFEITQDWKFLTLPLAGAGSC